MSRNQALWGSPYTFRVSISVSLLLPTYLLGSAYLKSSLSPFTTRYPASIGFANHNHDRRHHRFFTVRDCEFDLREGKPSNLKLQFEQLSPTNPQAEIVDALPNSDKWVSPPPTRSLLLALALTNCIFRSESLRVLCRDIRVDFNFHNDGPTRLYSKASRHRKIRLPMCRENLRLAKSLTVGTIILPPGAPTWPRDKKMPEFNPDLSEVLQTIPDGLLETLK